MKKLLVFAAVILLLIPLFSYGRVSFATCVIDGLLFPPEPLSLTLADGYQATFFRLAGGKGEPENAIFFVGGSGYNSLRYYLRWYFRHLRGNWVVYALQKRHVTPLGSELFGRPPEAFHRENVFERWISDQADFLNHMTSGKNTRYKNIVLFGVSEGGNVAAQTAAKVKTVTHLAVIGSGGFRQADELKSLYKGMNLDEEFTRIAQASQSLSLTTLGQTYKYWNSVLHVDPLAFYTALDIPVLVGMGEKDDSVPIASGRFLRDQMEKAGRKNLTFIEYPDSNHSLVDSKGQDHKQDFFARLERLIQPTPAANPTRTPTP